MPFNVVVCTPSIGQCRTSFAFSLARMVSYFSMVRVFPEIEQQSMDYMLMEGSGVASNREKMTRNALAKKDMTHILWIDEDTGFNMNTLHIMARRRQPIVACNYRMRVPPAEFTALKVDKTARIQTMQESTGLEEAWYSGFGFCLIERKVFEAVPEPRYLERWLPGEGTTHGAYTTEDHPFFAAAREAGFPCWVDHDASKNIWHVGNMNYVWTEDYSQLNKSFLPPAKEEPKLSVVNG